jgi:hypothetical protein
MVNSYFRFILPDLGPVRTFYVMFFLFSQAFLWTGTIFGDELKGNVKFLPGHASEAGTCRVEISFYFHHQPRMAGNQFAIWVEDVRGRYMATVFATRYTARGGYRQRPHSLPGWREASDWDRAGQSHVDAVSGATPVSGRYKAVWDCLDHQGRQVEPGTYIYKLEGNIFWENMVTWTGEIIIGDTPDQSEARALYTPDRAHRKGILIDEVRAEFLPEEQ